MEVLQGVILLVLMVVTLAAVSAACASPSGESSIRVTVADDQERRDDLAPGDPLIGGTIRIYQQDTVVLEESLDQDGRVASSLPQGVYTLQASLDSHLPGCFWGNTLYDVHLPQTSLNIAVSKICSGS